MNSRLSQILAASVRADGRPNRAKIYEELMILQDAPEAILIDAFFATDESFRALGEAQKNHLAAVQGVFDKELPQLVRELGLSKKAFAEARSELAISLATRSATIDTCAREMAKQCAASMAAAQKEAKASEEAVAKMVESAKQVAEAHRLATYEAKQIHDKLQALAQSLVDRSDTWGLFGILVLGIIIGLGAYHLWIRP